MTLLLFFLKAGVLHFTQIILNRDNYCIQIISKVDDLTLKSFKQNCSRHSYFREK